jgi:hypothetical protein
MGIDLVNKRQKGMVSLLTTEPTAWMEKIK